MTDRQCGWRPSGPGLLALLAALVFFGDAVSGVVLAQTDQTEQQKQDRNRQGEGEEGAKACAARDRREVSRNVAGRQVFVDPATGRLRPPTPEEARKLAEGLREMFSQSAEGLEVVRHPNGMLSVDLRGRFQHVAIATADGHGTISFHCANDTGNLASPHDGMAGKAAGPTPGDAATREAQKALSQHTSSPAREE